MNAECNIVLVQICIAPLASFIQSEKCLRFKYFTVTGGQNRNNHLTRMQ
jgi:hypothetical protein